MPSSQPAYILGGAQTDFARNWTREGLGLYDLLAEVVPAAYEDARLDPADTDVVHIGNLAGELFCGQAQLGGFVASIDPALAFLPSMRHEAACASGSMAAFAAMADLEAGRYDLALVVGVELMRNVPGQKAAEHLGSAAWMGREAVGAEFPWPHLFSRIADEVARRYGLQDEHLRHIAETNYANASRNPLAQTRDWDMEPNFFGPDDHVNPVIDGRLRKQDCGRITDGASAILLASPRFARAYMERRGGSIDDVAAITGWGHRTAPMLLDDKFALSEDQQYLFPHVRDAITDAYGRAGISGPDDLDAIETHDCFTITEYAVLDHLGLAEPGEAWQAIENGSIDFNGSTPVNPSGGLLAAGHPVGATGVRMLLDASRQVTGRAEGTQVEGARRVATLNVGGSCTTVAATVVERT